TCSKRDWSSDVCSSDLLNGVPNSAPTIQGAAFIVGALLGTPLSGAITTILSWEYIFWLNVLVGVIVILFTPHVIAKSTPVSNQQIGRASWMERLYLY